MAQKPQMYIEYNWVHAIAGIEKQVLSIATRLSAIKTQAEQIKSEVDADTDASADMVTLAGLVNNLVNNSKYTEFITFCQNNLD